MISYKEALELLKSQRPVYYKDTKKRKITGVTWRRDPDCIYASVEVLDEALNSVSHVRLDDIFTSEEEIESIDISKALEKINEAIEILQSMKSCFVYEDVERAKDAYNKLMRVCINLDSEIMALSLNLGNLEEVTDYSDLDYESIEAERRDFDKRLEEFDEDVLINEE